LAAALDGLNTALGVAICKMRSIPHSSGTKDPNLKKADMPHKDGLRAYIQKVEKVEGPFVLLP
jgi:hypothetical protein